jgi:hypothetical protein
MMSNKNRHLSFNKIIIKVLFPTKEPPKKRNTTLIKKLLAKGTRQESSQTQSARQKGEIMKNREKNEKKNH